MCVCHVAAGFRYDTASGLLMTTPAVYAALRSVRGAAALRSASSASTSAAGDAAVQAANAAAGKQAAGAYQQAWDLGIVINQLANEVLSR